jgi:FkbM family methyltransferase
MLKPLKNKLLFYLKREYNKKKKDPKTRISLSQVRKLYKLPAFTNHSIDWQNKTISFTDATSFLHTLNEIFGQDLYLFKSDNDQPLIIDIGSNIGLSILYFKKLYPLSTIVGFEPDPEIFAILLKNLKEFEAAKVNVYNSAAWKFDGELSFYSEGALSGSLYKIENSKAIKVPALDINKFISERDIDFLKIDVEGAEYDILNHIKKHLKKVKRIFVEYHDKKNTSQELHLILNILSEAGFSYYIKQESDSISHPYVSKGTWNFNFQLNIFAFRN